MIFAKITAITLAFLILVFLCVNMSPLSEKQNSEGILQALRRDIDQCGCFVYQGSTTNKQNLILMTDMPGANTTRAWVNLGQGDVELKKVSYHEDDKSIEFTFGGYGIEVKFKGKIVSPGSELREYDTWRGKLRLSWGTMRQNLVVYVVSGC